MLTRAEIDERLALLDKIIPTTDGGNVHLTEERDALAAENKRLRHFFSDGQFGDHLASATEDGDLPIEWALKTVAMVEAALSLQPPTASPSAPKAVSTDSELARLRRVADAAKKVSRESHKRIGLVIDTIPALDAALAEWEAVNE